MPRTWRLSRMRNIAHFWRQNFGLLVTMWPISRLRFRHPECDIPVAPPRHIAPSLQIAWLVLTRCGMIRTLKETWAGEAKASCTRAYHRLEPCLCRSAARSLQNIAAVGRNRERFARSLRASQGRAPHPWGPVLYIFLDLASGIRESHLCTDYNSWPC